ncbi:AraC family transcriptional regulator, partial [Sinorhizobium meliloti]
MGTSCPVYDKDARAPERLQQEARLRLGPPALAQTSGI